MYHHPLVLSIVLLVVAHCGMTMSFESLFPVLSRDRLGLEGGVGVMSGASYLMVGYGAAALITALYLAGVQSERTRGQLFLWLAMLSGVTPLALALAPNLALATLATAERQLGPRLRAGAGGHPDEINAIAATTRHLRRAQVELADVVVQGLKARTQMKD